MTEQTIDDEILGELLWNDDDECWSSQVAITLEQIVNVTIDPEDAETGGIILIARQNFIKLQQEETNIRYLIAEEMMPLYHQSWSNGETIDKEEFIETIRLEDIVFYSSGSTQLFYSDGDLFGGHGIVVAIDENGNYQNASLYG
jgi:hypothetical protein